MNRGYLPYFLLLLALLAFIFISGFNGLYGQDSYEYLRYSQALSEFIKIGTNPGDYFWPLLYPIMGAILSFILSPSFALQIISVLSLIFSAIYLEKLLVLLFNKEKITTRAFVFLFFVLSPYVLRNSLVIMSDGLSIFCVTAAWYYFEKYKREVLSKYFLAFTFFSASAISTRYASAVVLIIPAILIIILFVKNFRLPYFLITIIISTLLFLPHFLIRGHNSIDFIHHAWITSWSPANFFRNHFTTLDGNSSYSVFNLLYSLYNIFHPAFCFAGIVFLTMFYLNNRKTKIKQLDPIILTVLFYALFLAGIPFQNLRFLLLSFPLVLIVLFPGYIKIYESLASRRFFIYVIMLTIAFQLTLFYRAFIPFYNDNQTEKQIANQMLKYQYSTLYTFSIDGALKSYGFKGEIINMYKVRIDTLKVSDTNAVVLFNIKQFSEQWQDKNPMINWEYLNKKSKLVPLENLSNGWVLYKR